MNCTDHIAIDHKLAMGYSEWQHAASLSMAKGEKQAQCSGCQLWFFPWERSVTGTLETMTSKRPPFRDPDTLSSNLGIRPADVRKAVAKERAAPALATLSQQPSKGPRDIYWCHISNEPSFVVFPRGNVPHCSKCGSAHRGLENEHTFLGHLVCDATMAEAIRKYRTP